MNIQATFRPRRSCLYMPGANTRALEKAGSLPADTLILDLEDAVAPDAKAAARNAVHGAVSDGRYGKREVLVRVNSLDSEWGKDDVAMVVSASPQGVVVPKVASAAQVRQLDTALDEAGAGNDLDLWVMIETPQAILNLGEIAAMAGSTRLRGFILGLNDLALETGALPTPGRAAFQVALSMAVMAAKAHGLVVIDGVYNDFRDEAGLVLECEQGRLLGFDGKSLIHPAQIDSANRIFAPDAADLARARAIIDAFALPENQGKGVIQVDGKMTELLHLEQSKRLVAISDAIAASA